MLKILEHLLDTRLKITRLHDHFVKVEYFPYRLVLIEEGRVVQSEDEYNSLADQVLNQIF